MPHTRSEITIRQQEEMQQQLAHMMGRASTPVVAEGRILLEEARLVAAGDLATPAQMRLLHAVGYEAGHMHDAIRKHAEATSLQAVSAKKVDALIERYRREIAAKLPPAPPAALPRTSFLGLPKPVAKPAAKPVPASNPVAAAGMPAPVVAAPTPTIVPSKRLSSDEISETPRAGWLKPDGVRRWTVADEIPW